MEVVVKPRTKKSLLAYLMAALLAINIVPLSAFASGDGQTEPTTIEPTQAVGEQQGAVLGQPAATPGESDPANDASAENPSEGDAAGSDTGGAGEDAADNSGSDASDGSDPDGMLEGTDILEAGDTGEASSSEALQGDAVELREGNPVDIKTLWPAGTPDADRTIVGGMTVDLTDASGNPLPQGQDPTIDSRIHMMFPLKVPATVTAQIKAGDTYSFDLPKDVSIGKGINDVALADPDDPSIVYATFKVTPSGKDTPAKVTIAFTDAINGQGDVEGTLGFSGGFNAETIGEPGKITLEVPYEKNIPPTSITITPATDSDVAKAGSFDQPTNPTAVIWSVDVNKSLKQMTNGSVSEEFPQGLTFAGVDVYQVPVDFYGNVVGDIGGAGWIKLDASGYTASSDGSTVALNAPYDSTDKAYRFVYRTTIDEDVKPQTGGGVSFTNTAVLHSDEAGTAGLPAQASVSAHFGKTLDKSGATYDPSTRTITWRVQYNYGGHAIPAGSAWVEDICDYPDLEYIDGSVTVQKMKFDSQGKAVVDSDIAEGTEAGRFTFSNNPDEHRIRVDLNGGVDYPVLVTYKTKVTSVVDSNKTYVNTALTEGTPPPVAHDSITIGQHNIIKRMKHADLDAKTLTWSIDINTSRYEMHDFRLTDSLVLGLSHTIADSGAIVVYDKTAGTTVPEVQSFGEDGYLLFLSTDADGNHIGFNMQFTGAYAKTDHAFEVEYTTKYDAMRNPPDGSQTFINSAASTWEDADGTTHTNDYTATYRPTPPDGSNGMKSGSYNAVEKKITWSVLVNYARTGLLNASIKDAILPGQTYVDGSLKIYPYTIRSNGSTVKGTELTPEQMAKFDIDLPGEGNNQTLTVGFPDGDNLYWIEFDTSVSGTVIAATYDNTAILHNEAETSGDISLSAKVSVKHGGSPVEKSGIQDADGYASWNLTVNPTNSTLSDVLVTDTPSSDQSVDLDSLVVNGTTVDAAGNLTVDPQTVLKKDTDYTVDYVQDGTGQWQLKIAFANTIESAYVISYRATVYADSNNPMSQTTNTAKITGTNKIEVDDNTTSSVLVELNKGEGVLKGTRKDLVIHKVDADGANLAGAKFQLFNANGQPVGGVAQSDENGTITYAGIVTGTYTLKEVEPAPGYTMSEELANGIEIELKADSTPFELENDLTEVSMVKQNADGDPVAGAKFALERFDGSSWTAVADLPAPLDLESAADGSIVIRGLEPGHYRLSEIEAPYPYVLGEPLEFDVSYRSDSAKIVDPLVLPPYVNERFAGELRILKTDTDGNPLAGAEFEIQDTMGAIVEEGIMTDADGRATVTGLAEGSYSLVETKAPQGYKLDWTPHAFEVAYSQEGQTIEITLENELEPATPKPPDPSPKTPEPPTPQSPETPQVPKALAQTGDRAWVLGPVTLAGLAAVGVLGMRVAIILRRRSARGEGR